MPLNTVLRSEEHTSELQENGVKLIDCQVHTDHLESLGAEEISRKEFLKFLQ